ncbi:MAG TPA: NAD-dependent epimerase/dehydratase family protein, partial [Salinisphaeraceae bacterium]|nr:NAD-dependent epimerase/dehydratase family protein [Salinisphaeraceae bacterium]
LRAIAGEPITIYGDGKQVRDVLFVDDLVAAFAQAEQNMQTLAGHACNIGGGPDNTLSLRELLQHMRQLGLQPQVEFADWRTGDQPYYVSDTRSFQRATGWRAHVPVRAGLRRLHAWLAQPATRARTAASMHDALHYDEAGS